VVGFTPARRGRIVFNQVDITASPSHDIFRRHLAIVPQGRRIFTSLTVEENLLIACQAAASGRQATGEAQRTSSTHAGTVEEVDAWRAKPEPWSLRRVYSLFPRLLER